MKIRVILILLLCLCIGSGYAQKKATNTDSLQLVKLVPDGRVAARNLEKTGLESLLKALKITGNKKTPFYNQQKTEALMGIASYYMNKGKYDSAFYYNEHLLAHGLEIKDGLVVARANLGFGNVANYRGDFETAIAKNLLALNYFESVHDTTGIMPAMGNIGLSYVRLKQYPKAIDFLNRSIALYLKRNQIIGAANNMANLSLAYKALKDRPKELELKLKAYDLFKSQNYKKGMATAAIKLGIYYVDVEPNTALKYFTEALILSRQINDQGNIAFIYSGLGDLYLKLNRADLAEPFVDSALYLARKSGDRLALADAMLFKANILHSRGQHVKGRQFNDRYIEIRDSVFAETMQGKVAEMEIKYETEKKQQQIALLAQRNTIQGLSLKNQGLQLQHNNLEIRATKADLEKNKLLTVNQQLQLKDKQAESETRGQKVKLLQKQNIIQQLQITHRDITIVLVLGLLAMVLISGYLFYNRYRLKQAARLQQAIIQQQGLAAQGIMEAEERERKRIAGDLHDGVGQLLSSALFNLNLLINNVELNADQAKLANRSLTLVNEGYDEVRTISHQIIPNFLLKYGLSAAVRDFLSKIDEQTIEVSLEIGGIKDSLGEQLEIQLYRMIQEAVNNVIKHARANKLSIQLHKDDEGINLNIEDNGIGFSPANLADNSGIGMRNIQSRVAFLKGNLDIQSNPGEGTLVAIFIPA